ncbi:putative NodU family carbamoyl transferase [Nocardiopsis mwathae]|uniref:Putative NodU family carbamoyl transferase n=1 Tax=Nocardiopsis mwathae TaxID=1472723 RepID=A0A7W9YNA2_9ACTN|nr:carbamoyltransferase C-terminal domain-containing protein [Nocardiopsis mwathae]MBB6175125.1 putative NodU family carbamoyl transferase [Nocardiopsis mwathae]
MAVLGLSGLFSTEEQDYDPATFHGFYHDAAACLVENSQTLAAIEEERLNRDKHTNRFPARAARACLEVAGLRPQDISHVAYFFEEEFTDRDVARVGLQDPRMPLRGARGLVHDRLAAALGSAAVRDLPITFVSHHRTHAASAYHDSGLSSALVFVCDGNGERDGLSVFHGADGDLRRLRGYPRDRSLGHFYTAITRMVGYRDFDEYKVMGLASFGDPARYRDVLAPLCTLGPDGEYDLRLDDLLGALFDAGLRPRRAHEPLRDEHRDLAAAAQDLVERVSLHLIGHWLNRTGLRDLCLAGGVAQNTSLNGRLLGLPTLDHVYVPAAAHDAGGALGAAMVVDRETRGRATPSPGHRYSANAYLGAALGTETEIAARLALWSDFIEVDRPAAIETTIAKELADGAVIGWAQGRAEFGPRALGNRSIFADPRPSANRDRVNLLIKQREDYRPFAPVVTEPDAARFFDLSTTSADHSYMGFVVPVRPEHRAYLGAVTHVDGTARVQTLREQDNPLVWRLLKEFERVTDVPVLLNTSFNNHAEPIVQSVDDAVATFLTTGLSLLVVGPYLVRRRTTAADPEGGDGVLRALRSSTLELMPFCEIRHSVGRLGEHRSIVRTAHPMRPTPISPGAQELLTGGGRIADRALPPEAERDLLCEVHALWNDRLVRVVPGSR